jgi:hypothetical protein
MSKKEKGNQPSGQKKGEEGYAPDMLDMLLWL